MEQFLVLAVVALKLGDLFAIVALLPVDDFELVGPVVDGEAQFGVLLVLIRRVLRRSAIVVFWVSTIFWATVSASLALF